MRAGMPNDRKSAGKYQKSFFTELPGENVYHFCRESKPPMNQAWEEYPAKFFLGCTGAVFGEVDLFICPWCLCADFDDSQKK